MICFSILISGCVLIIDLIIRIIDFCKGIIYLILMEICCLFKVVIVYVFMYFVFYEFRNIGSNYFKDVFFFLSCCF